MTSRLIHMTRLDAKGFAGKMRLAGAVAPLLVTGCSGSHSADNGSNLHAEIAQLRASVARLEAQQGAPMADTAQVPAASDAGPMPVGPAAPPTSSPNEWHVDIRALAREACREAPRKPTPVRLVITASLGASWLGTAPDGSKTSDRRHARLGSGSSAVWWADCDLVRRGTAGCDRVSVPVPQGQSLGDAHRFNASVEIDARTDPVDSGQPGQCLVRVRPEDLSQKGVKKPARRRK